MANGLGFVDPSAGGKKETTLLAPRPSDLAGKVVGLLDNTKEQADIILQMIGDALCERYGVERVMVRRKEHYSKPVVPPISPIITTASVSGSLLKNSNADRKFVPMIGAGWRYFAIRYPYL